MENFSLDSNDILKEIADEDLVKVADLYKPLQDALPQVYSFLRIAIKSKSCGMKDFVKVTSPNNSWKKDGTIIGIIRSNDLNCQVFLHTLDQNAENLVEGLRKTNLIPLTGKSKGFVMFYGIHESINPMVENALKTYRKLPFFENGKWTINYCLHKELSTKLDVKLPKESEVYVHPLRVKDAEIINDSWPHKSEGSVDFVRDLIKLNKGFGLYLKTSNEIIAWVCISVFGQMSLLYTMPEHRNKGYGLFLIHYTAKYMADEDGLHAIGTTVVLNKSAEKLFEKAGFKRLHFVNYISVNM